MTVARPRVGPPALGRAALPGAEPPNPGSRPGAGRAMGMVVGPGPPTQRSQTRHGKLFPRAFIRLESPTDTPDRPESQRLEGTDRRWTNSRQVFKTASTGRPLQGPVCTGYPAALRLHSQSAIPHQPELGAGPARLCRQPNLEPPGAYHPCRAPRLEAAAQQEDRRFTPSLCHSRIDTACDDAGVAPV
jgi:hypothetical protein